tara:strand:- start:724 stop:1464 length:741 start_codon:yes stop_codon:yes gene_type:complete
MCKHCGDIGDLKNEVDYATLLPILERLIGQDVTKMASVTPAIWKWVEEQYLESQAYLINTTRSFVKSTEDNIYNYSLAKAYSFNKELKVIKKTVDVSDVAKLVTQKASVYFGTFQDVENKQVNRITETVTNFDVKDDIYLEYIATQDNTRPTHSKANGTILRKSHPWWNSTGIPLLGEFNCNCQIDEDIQENPTQTTAPKIKIDNDQVASNVDIDSGKAIIFKEDIGYFNDVDDTVTRKRYKKTGF